MVVFVIVDFIVKTKNYYNLISLCGVFVYIFLLFCFSVAPRQASTVACSNLFFGHLEQMSVIK